MADLSGNGSKQAWVWPVIISVLVAVAQFIGYGTVIGRMQNQIEEHGKWIDERKRFDLSGLAKQVDINTDWIRARNSANLDVRLAVLESEYRLMEVKVGQVDDHLDAVDQALQNHVREDARRYEPGAKGSR